MYKVNNGYSVGKAGEARALRRDGAQWEVVVEIFQGRWGCSSFHVVSPLFMLHLLMASLSSSVNTHYTIAHPSPDKTASIFGQRDTELVHCYNFHNFE